MDYAPTSTEIHILTPNPDELIPWIDWDAFIYGWDIHGTWDSIQNQPEKVKAAQQLRTDAEAFLASHSAIFAPQSVCGVFPAQKHGDDFTLTRNDGESFTFHSLRQQTLKNDKSPYLALSDFIKENDFVGAFAATAGPSAEWIAKLQKEHDPYTALIAQSLFNRFAEAMAEYTHMKLRRDYWGYAQNENLTIPQILKGAYQGFRPAPGYPAQPDHSEKFTLFKLLNVEEHIHVTLTENAMMLPEASCCALCFARPQAQSFTVGKIGQDQREDYARRKGWTESEAHKWIEWE